METLPLWLLLALPVAFFSVAASLPWMDWLEEQLNVLSHN